MKYRRFILSFLSTVAFIMGAGSLGAVELHQISLLQGFIQVVVCTIVGLVLLVMALPDKGED